MGKHLKLPKLKIQRVRALLGIFWLMGLFLQNACTVGPNYAPPCMEVPEQFKEAPKGWKFACPCDAIDRGPWWEMFHDPLLTKMMCRVGTYNENIAVAFAQYQQARVLIDQNSAAFYPLVFGDASITEQKVSSSGGIGSTSPTGAVIGTSGKGSGFVDKFTTYSISGTATWVPDLWGSVKRMVEASIAGAQASAAQMAAVTLSMQGTLAQTYFQLRAADLNQKILDDTVIDYRKTLQITINRYNAGTAQRLDILQAQSQLDTAINASQDNKIARAQFEHAIAVLMGMLPECLSIKPIIQNLTPPCIPGVIASTLLERRPDIAQAERLVAEANANIGVAIAAFFPSITITSTGGYQSTDLSKLFSAPASFWSIGGQLMQTIYDGGVLIAKKDIACAAYNQSIANYRQVVLSAFQNVEDNLVQLRILKSEVRVQADAVDKAAAALKIIINQYRVGTAQYSDVILAQNTLYAARQTLVNLKSRQMVAAVGLIMALGGGFHMCDVSAAGYEEYVVTCPCTEQTANP